MRNHRHNLNNLRLKFAHSISVLLSSFVLMIKCVFAISVLFLVTIKTTMCAWKKRLRRRSPSRLKCLWKCIRQWNLVARSLMYLRIMISTMACSSRNRLSWGIRYKISSRNGGKLYELLRWKLLIACILIVHNLKKNLHRLEITITKWLMRLNHGWIKLNINLTNIPIKL